MNAKRVTVNILAIVGGIALVGGAIYYFGRKIVAGIGIGTPMLKDFKWLYGIKNGVNMPIGITGKLYIPITNQNAFSIPTPRFTGNILYQNKFPLANVVIDNPVTLSAGANTTLIANVNIDFEKLSSSAATVISKLFTGGFSLPSFYVDGDLEALNKKIHINQYVQVFKI